MINNACIIILCNVPWDWSTDYINQTAFELSKKNTVICFFWLEAKSLKEYIQKPGTSLFFQKKQKNIYMYYGFYFIPFRRWNAIQKLNLYINVWIVRVFIGIINISKHFTNKILWYFDAAVFPFLQPFGQSYITIYDCVDYYVGGYRLSAKQKAVSQRIENNAIKESDVVTVNSHILYHHHSQVRSDIHLVPQGFRFDVFRKRQKYPIKLPHDIPIVGYVGAINDRLDYLLLVRLAKQCPDFLFVFIGPILDVAHEEGLKRVAFATKHLFTQKNVLYMGAIDKKYIPDLIGQFTVGIIPYRVTDAFNRNSFPMKLFEYFYMGKPVISSDIFELRHYPRFVTIARNTQEWKKGLEKIINNKWAYQGEQRTEAIRHSWARKIQAISEQIF